MLTPLLRRRSIRTERASSSPLLDLTREKERGGKQEQVKDEWSYAGRGEDGQRKEKGGGSESRGTERRREGRREDQRREVRENGEKKEGRRRRKTEREGAKSKRG